MGLKKTGIAPIVQLHQNNRGKAMPVNLYYTKVDFNSNK